MGACGALFAGGGRVGSGSSSLSARAWAMTSACRCWASAIQSTSRSASSSSTLEASACTLDSAVGLAAAVSSTACSAEAWSVVASPSDGPAADSSIGRRAGRCTEARPRRGRRGRCTGAGPSLLHTAVSPGGTLGTSCRSCRCAASRRTRTFGTSTGRGSCRSRCACTGSSARLQAPRGRSGSPRGQSCPRPRSCGVGEWGHLPALAGGAEPHRRQGRCEWSSREPSRGRRPGKH